MAYDPEENTPSHLIIEQYFNSSAQTYPIPDYLEPELKYLVTSDKSCFLEILNTLQDSDDILSAPDFNIFPNGYALLSVGMDTVSQDGTPTRKIAQAGYQYRVRGNLPDNSKDFFAQVDATMKCRSKNMASHRQEIETENGGLQKENISRSLLALRALGNKHLPRVFEETSDDELRVETLCMTSRNNYYFELQVEEGLLARYHACMDANTFLTPDASIQTGRDLEAEFEISEFISSTPLSAEEVKEKISLAQDKLRSIIEPHHEASMIPSPASKLVRAAKSVVNHYKTYNEHLSPQDADHFSPEYLPAQWPLTLGIKPQDIITDASFKRLSEFKKSMLRPEEIVDMIPFQGNQTEKKWDIK